MLRTPLRALLAGAMLLVAAAPSAHAADPVIALDVIADHDVVWDYVSGDPDDECSSSVKGAGTQSIRIRTDRREQMRLERAFGSVLLTGKRSGTFHATVDRTGRWRERIGLDTPACTSCGPNSEMGPCGPPVQQPRPLRFECGERKGLNPNVALSFLESKGIPSIEKGLEGQAWIRKERYFDNCPPTLPRGHVAPRLVNEWPDWVDLPKADTARIAKLQPGDSVVAEVTVQRTYVDQGGTVTKGTRCAGMPEIDHGYGECAVTTYSFTFTRLS